MKLVGSFFSLLVCMGCSASTESDGWEITFSCPTDAARSTHLLLKITEESCAADAEVVFETTVERGARPERPAPLAQGLYGLSATAFEGEQEIAFGCVVAKLPSDLALRIALTGVAACRVTSENERDAEPEGALQTPDAGQSEAEAPHEVPLDASLPNVDDAAAIDMAALDARTAEAAVAFAADAGDAAQRDAARASDAGALRSLLTLQLTYSGSSTDQTWRALASAAATPDDAILKLVYDRAAASSQRVQAAPAPVITLPSSIFRTDAELDAFALLPDGRFLLSTSESARLGDEPVEDDELIAYDPRTQGFARYFHLATVAGPNNGSDSDIDAVQVMSDGSLYFSVHDTMKLHATGALVSASDLLLYNSVGVTRVVDGNANWAGRDLSAIAVDPDSGRFLISLAGSGAIGSGAAFDGDDVIELSFGPGQPYASGYTLFMDGSAELSAPDGSLSALHVTK